MNDVAHGPQDGGVSYFTAALLRCLESLGAGSPLVGPKWRVTTDSLRRAMEELMRRTKLPDDSFGQCDSGGSNNTFGPPTVLHVLPGAASVQVRIAYEPEAGHDFVSLSIERHGNPPKNWRPPPGPWELELEAAHDDVRARFDGGQYPDAELLYQAMSPTTGPGPPTTPST